MGVITDFDEERINPVGSLPDNALRLSNLSAHDPSVKTHRVGTAAIGSLDTLASEATRPLSITESPSHGERVHRIATDHQIAKTPPSGSVALAALQAALRKEEVSHGELRALSAKVRGNLKTIDQLVGLLPLLPVPGAADSYEISGAAQTQLSLLKEQGIDLFAKGGNKIKKEELSALRSLISTQIEKCHKAVHLIVNTEIHPKINELTSIMNLVQRMMDTDARMKKHINDNSRK